MLTQTFISKILFPAPHSSYEEDSFPDELIWVSKVPGNTETIQDSDEEDVPCLILPYPYARFLMIYLHGNAEDLGRSRAFCCYLREQFQVHVLAVEYPGYGICPGMPTEQSVMANVRAAFNFATTHLQWPLDGIMAFGRSIGTGPAVTIAAELDIAGLVLVAPFLSVKELFHDRIGALSGLVGVEEWFPNDKLAGKITCPTLIIHGKRDRLICVRHGQSLYEHIRSPKMLVSPPHMEHNTNLISNLQSFVLPMFQFFTLPDCVFHEMDIPEWAYRRRNTAGRRSWWSGTPLVDAGDMEAPAWMGDQPMIPFVVREEALGNEQRCRSEAGRRNQPMTRPRRPSTCSSNGVVFVQGAINSVWRRCCNNDSQPMERETEHSEELSFMVSMRRSAPPRVTEEKTGAGSGLVASPAAVLGGNAVLAPLEPGPGAGLRQGSPLRSRHEFAAANAAGDPCIDRGEMPTRAPSADAVASGDAAVGGVGFVHNADGMANGPGYCRDKGGPPQGLWEMKIDRPASDLDPAAPQGTSACQPCCDSLDPAVATATNVGDADVQMQLGPRRLE